MSYCYAVLFHWTGLTHSQMCLCVCVSLLDCCKWTVTGHVTRYTCTIEHKVIISQVLFKLSQMS